MRLADSRVIAISGAERRIAARALLDVGRGHGLLGFHVVDTHVHLLSACPRVTAGCPFDPARIRPVTDQWHLQRTIVYIVHH